jgi:hypothetical protein
MARRPPNFRVIASFLPASGLAERRLTLLTERMIYCGRRFAGYGPRIRLRLKLA